MNNYDIVFEKLAEAVKEETAVIRIGSEPTASELDEIEELRRFSAELMEPEPISLTTT
jgi:hypothetical protein